mmetsp:Transcript_100218/g.238988  ORF Transcript_100218/g.238988 Transcript_100218/m.238988 type:complete len:110 (+) Transcript_100218:43-372(+)
MEPREPSPLFASRLWALAEALDQVTPSLPAPGDVPDGDEGEADGRMEEASVDELSELVAAAEDTDSEDEGLKPERVRSDRAGFLTDVLLGQRRDAAGISLALVDLDSLD